MKRIILSLTLLFLGVVVFSQENQDNTERYNRRNKDQYQRNQNRQQAPSTVQQAWQREHGNNENPRWQLSNGEWRAQYNDQANNRQVNTYYDQSGRQIDTHRQWDRNNMPSQYNENINRRYHTNNYDIYRIERPNQKEVYQLRMKNHGRSKTIYTDENGTPINYKDRHKD